MRTQARGLVRCLLIGWLLLGGLVAAGLPAARAGEVIVAAASSLRPRLDEVIRAFSREHRIGVEANYAASGTLVQQVLHGAPYGVFVSASPAFLVPLRQAGRVCAGPVTVGHGRLALFVSDPVRIPPRPDLGGLKQALDRGRMQHLAIADPAIAPYGELARQALQAAGLWQAVQAHLVYGESAAQAARFARTGTVDAALLPAHLLAPPDGRRWVYVAEALYRPTALQAVWLCGGSQDSRALFEYLRRHLGVR